MEQKLVKRCETQVDADACTIHTGFAPPESRGVYIPLMLASRGGYIPLMLGRPLIALAALLPSAVALPMVLLSTMTMVIAIAVTVAMAMDIALHNVIAVFIVPQPEK